jgi:hypothetical protein
MNARQRISRQGKPTILAVSSAALRQVLHAWLCFAVVWCCCCVASSALAQPTGGSSLACPSKKFEVFFKAFIDDAALQRAFTKLPVKFAAIEPHPREIFALKYYFIKTYDDIPIITSKQTVFPDSEERSIDGLEFTFQSSGDRAKAKMFKPDTNYHVFYHFRRDRKCWHLVTIVDNST